MCFLSSIFYHVFRLHTLQMQFQLYIFVISLFCSRPQKSWWTRPSWSKAGWRQGKNYVLFSVWFVSCMISFIMKLHCLQLFLFFLRGRKRNLLPIILWEEMSCWMTAHKKKKKKNSAPSYNFSALHLVHDPQEFAENLFRPLVPCNIIEGFSYSVQSFGQFMFYYHVFFKVVIFVVSFSHWSHFFHFRKGCEDEEDC